MSKAKSAGARGDAAAPKIFEDGYSAQPLVAATRRIMLVGRRYRRVLDQALKEIGHSQARWEILHAISLDGDECTLMEVAAHIGLEGPSIVGTMEKLEAGAFIERRENGKDRRSRLIRLTPQGKEALAAMTEVVRQQREKLWRGVSATDLDTMLRVLTQLRMNLWGDAAEDAVD